MQFEDAFKVIDDAILSQAGRHLNAPEVTLLKGTWQGMTYEQMSDNSQYSLNYLMRDVGPKFWRLLSSALGKEVSKTNIRLLMEKQNGFKDSLLEVKSSLPLTTASQSRRTNVEKLNSAGPERLNPVWDVMPEIPMFCGRDEEIELLTRWVVDEQLQLVSICGLSGVGKTALARLFVDEVQDSFELVLWRSVAHAPSLQSLIQHIFASLEESYSQTSNPISQLMELMKSRRCLLILDGLEGILQSPGLAGEYRNGFEDYGELFSRLSDVSHQSCLLVTGLEIPREIVSHKSDAIAVRNMYLDGLHVQDAQALLESEQLGDKDVWSQLIDRYAGYPGCLIAVSNLSHTLFNGRVGSFLSHQTFVFGEVSHQLGKSFDRTSPLEKEVLFFLSLQGEPLSFASIESGLPMSVSGRELFEVLASLKSRSLLVTPEVKGQSLFGLSQIVMEYVTSVLIQALGGESQTALSPSRLAKNGETEEVLDLSGSRVQLPIKLTSWLNQQSSPGWQPFANLLNEPEQLAVRLRSLYHLRGEEQEKRFKRLAVGDNDGERPVALLVAVSQEIGSRLGVRVQVQSLNPQGGLPNKLSLSLLNGSGETLKTAVADAADNDVRLPLFRGAVNESFAIRLDWKNTQVQESFTI